jgi:hypothetical protein
MTRRFRPYTGDIGYAAGLLHSATSHLRQEAKMLEMRLWNEYLAHKHVTDALPQIRADLAAAQKTVKDIEDTLTTVAEQQEDAA